MREAEQMNPNDSYSDDEIDLKELFQVLWVAKKLIIQVTAVFAISSLVFSLLLTNYYRSESLMTATSNTQNQSMLSQYSGLASFAGINLPASVDNKAMEAIEIIQSRNFVKHLLTFEDILASIMASKSYDSSSKELLFDQKIYDSETKIWNGQKKPSYLDAYEEYIENIISVSQESNTGFISIKAEHISPIFAKEFLELIIREANVLMRERDMEKSSQALEFLKTELSQTSLIEIQDAINSLIEAQLETQMLAQINEDYVLVTIEPPFIPEKKSKPNRMTILMFSLMLGLISGISTVLIKHYFQIRK